MLPPPFSSFFQIFFNLLSRCLADHLFSILFLQQDSYAGYKASVCLQYAAEVLIAHGSVCADHRDRCPLAAFIEPKQGALLTAAVNVCAKAAQGDEHAVLAQHAVCAIVDKVCFH